MIPSFLREDLRRLKLGSRKGTNKHTKSFRISTSRSEVFGEKFNQSYDPSTAGHYKSLEESLEKVPLNLDNTDLNKKAQKIGLYNLKRLRVKNKALFRGLFERRDIERMKVQI
jgi:hypothetical protein